MSVIHCEMFHCIRNTSIKSFKVKCFIVHQRTSDPLATASFLAINKLKTRNCLTFPDIFLRKLESKFDLGSFENWAYAN